MVIVTHTKYQKQKILNRVKIVIYSLNEKLNKYSNIHIITFLPIFIISYKV